jgi:hypothetical protein
MDGVFISIFTKLAHKFAHYGVWGRMILYTLVDKTHIMLRCPHYTGCEKIDNL